MPEWYFDRKDLRNTCSFKDGIDFEIESQYRRDGARFISDVGLSLNLNYDTIATASVYYHRFFMFHSFRDFSRFVAALGCLFLAGKVEETPKKCKDLIRVAREKLTDQDFAAFGEDPREEIMIIERVLLQTIKFDLQVDHPYQFLLRYAKVLKGDKEKIRNMAQMAWTFVNDSLCTTLCLQWEPEVIAIALMYLACRLSKFEVADWVNRKGLKNERWWDQFVEDISMDLLEDICHQVLDLYSNSSPKDKLVKACLPGKTSSSSAPNTPGTTPPVVRSDAVKLPPVVPTMSGVKPPLIGAAPIPPSYMGMPPMNLQSAPPPPPAADPNYGGYSQYGYGAPPPSYGTPVNAAPYHGAPPPMGQPPYGYPPPHNPYGNPPPPTNAYGMPPPMYGNQHLPPPPYRQQHSYGGYPPQQQQYQQQSDVTFGTNFDTAEMDDLTVNRGDWVLVEFNNKRRPAYRVARVERLLDQHEDNRDYEVKCVRRSQESTKILFEFPQKPEVLLIEHDRVQMILHAPTLYQDAKLLEFSVDLSRYNIM